MLTSGRTVRVTARDKHTSAGPGRGKDLGSAEGTPENHPGRTGVASAFHADNEHTPEDSPLGLEVQDNG
jgi:hypothetical protein